MNEMIEQLREYKINNRITINELSNLIGVDPKTMWRWLHNKHTPNRLGRMMIEKLLSSAYDIENKNNLLRRRYQNDY